MLDNWFLRVQQVFLPSIRCLMCHMTFADGSSIIAHYDTAHAPSLVRLHSSRLEWHISGTKFADSSSKRRHLRSANASFDVKMIQCNLCPTSLKPKSREYPSSWNTDALTDARQIGAWRLRQEVSDKIQNESALLNSFHRIVQYFSMLRLKSVRRSVVVKMLGKEISETELPLSRWC